MLTRLIICYINVDMIMIDQNWRQETWAAIKTEIQTASLDHRLAVLKNKFTGSYEGYESDLKLVESLFRGLNHHEIINKTSAEAASVEVIRQIRICMRIKRAKWQAALLGLHYWPALAFGPKVDPRAYIEAEQIMLSKGHEPWDGRTHWGGWDMSGNYGIDPWLVAQAWFSAGCKPGAKFRRQILERRIAPKRLSPRQTAAWMRTVRMMDEVHVTDNTSIRTQDKVRLGYLSAFWRWAALRHCTSNKGKVDWRALATYMRQPKRKVALALNVPDKYLWPTFAGLPPQDLPGGLNPLRPKWSIKLYKELLAIIGQGDRPGREYALPAYNLACICKSRQEIIRLAKASGLWDTLTSAIIHDLGQGTTPDIGANIGQWKALALRYGTSITRHAGAWKSIEEALGRVPRTLKEFRAVLGQMAYEPVEGSTPAIVQACAQAKMDQWQYEGYCRWYNMRLLKTSESVPAPQGITDGTLSLVQLEAHDPRAPLAGIYTHCCQHPQGAAADCARASIEEPRAAVWAIMDASGTMVAQAFVWVADLKSDRILVLDSTESPVQGSDTMPKRIASMLLEALRQIKGRLGVTKFYIGDTEYGITKEIKQHLPTGETVSLDGLSPASYTDAGNAVEVLV